MTTWEIRDNRLEVEISQSINAPAGLVYGVLADFESYPQFVNDLVSVRREGDLYHFVARAAILTIPATIRVSQTPGRVIRFQLVEGPLDRLEGAWQVAPGETPQETKVTLSIQAETDERGQWLLRMTRKYIEGKTDKLINAFRNRVLEIQRTGDAPAAPAPGGGLLDRLKRLWAGWFGRPAEVAPARPPSLFRDEHSARTLEALAATMLPGDDFDDGVQGLGFVSVAEIRSRYEAGREELYRTALAAVDQMARTMFDRPDFASLAPEERVALLDAARHNRAGGEAWGTIKPSSFFSALWEDTVFLYCTHPETWQRIGFPGPSFDRQGYPDFAGPQQFMGVKK